MSREKSRPDSREKSAPPERRYQHTQKHYADTFGKSLATIKRWWAKGMPLDDPDAMGEYLSPRGRKAEEDFESPSITTPPDPEEGDDLPIALDESFFKGSGALAAIERLNKAERERAAAYFDAIRKKLPAQLLANRFKEWIGIIEALRKLAKDEPEIRKSNDLTIDKTEVEAGLSHLLNGFRQAARNLPTRAAGKLRGLTEHHEIVDVLEREVDVLLRALETFTIEEAAKAEAEAA